MLYLGCTSWRSWQAQVHGLSGFWDSLKRYASCAVRKKMKNFIRLTSNSLKRKGTSSDLSRICRNQLLSLSLILQLYWLANVLTIYCVTIYCVMDSVGSPRWGYLTNFWVEVSRWGLRVARWRFSLASNRKPKLIGNLWTSTSLHWWVISVKNTNTFLLYAFIMKLFTINGLCGAYIKGFGKLRMA